MTVTADAALQQPTLETERLLLRPFRLSDASDVRRLAGAFEIADTTLTIPHPYPEGTAELWIATHATGFLARTQATFAIEERATRTLAGAIGLHIEPRHSIAELGYWIGLPFWGQGYATEAGRSIVAFGFTTLALNRIQARHFARNPASGSVMRKLGMSCEGTLRQAMKKWDRFEDVVMFSVLASEAHYEATHE
jgi:ribosomal-protein-alanine N-acetyltransferase